MKPLEGIRVVDLSQWRSGAQVTQTLADFGAEVLWIEPPGGSRLRDSRGFPFYGRGKQSLVLDLHNPEDRARALDLIASADVLVECFRPGVAERLGLDYASLAHRNPRLVHASITGFGRHGPHASLRAYEGVVQAKLGVFKTFERMSNDPSHPPYVRAPWCSFGATQLALHGILTALYEREASGQGQLVETTLVQGFAALDVWDWFRDLVAQRYPDAFQAAPAAEGGVPLSPGVYMLLLGLTKDGHWLQFAQVAPRLFMALMRALELDWMFTDEYWKGIPVFEDAERRLELFERMHQAVQAKTLAEWQEIFEKDPDVFAEVARVGSEVLDHPQLTAIEGVVEVNDPLLGSSRQPGALTRIKGLELDVARPAPALDEHGDLSSWKPKTEPRAHAEAAAPPLPLEGITVVEMAVQFAAPFGATVLTDLGARVIKIEPLEGDPIRTMIEFPEAGGAKVMQGKDSICVDITTEEGSGIVRRIIADADVVLNGFRAGVAERRGLGEDDLRQLNPDLVYVTASGYGDGGPLSDRPAFAPSIGSASGIVRANVGNTVASEPGQPIDVVRESSLRMFASASIPQAQADGFAALGVGTSILLGLLGRKRGCGAHRVSSAMLVTAIHAMIEDVIDNGDNTSSADVDLRGLSALQRIYDAAQGWVYLQISGDAEWQRFVTVMAPYVDLSDPRFADASSRQAHDSELVEVLSGVFPARTDLEWEETLTAVDIAGVAVETEQVERYLQGEIGQQSGFVTQVEHPTFGDHLRLAPYVRFSRSATVAKPGVLAGQSTVSVLTELGYSDEQIADLQQRSVIGC